MNKLKLITITLATLVLLTACGNEKNKLDNRVIDYWTHKVNGEFDKAYEFLSPGWKSNESKETFIRRMEQSAANWLSVEIKDKKCNEKHLCTVASKIEYEYHFKGGMAGKMRIPSEVKETWLMKDNVWYYVPR